MANYGELWRIMAKVFMANRAQHNCAIRHNSPLVPPQLKWHKSLNNFVYTNDTELEMSHNKSGRVKSPLNICPFNSTVEFV